MSSGKHTTTAPSDRRAFGRWQTPARKVLAPVFNRAWKVKVNGAEHIPEDGPAILCANHNAFIDSFFIPLAVGRRVTFVGKAEYLDDWKTRTLLPNLGMVPIDRRGGAAATRALDTAAEVLDAGELFAIYPEGTRSRTGELHKGRTGAARLALRTGAPIIPVGLRGTREIQPPDRAVPAIGKRVEVHIGAPISVGHLGERAGRQPVLRQITDAVMGEIQALSGQDYVHAYANGRRTAPASASAVEPAAVPGVESVSGSASADRRELALV
ncbi:MAG: 1-acyl-sn-glycerol-3-phosphate acyltransferase [Acidimicrobiales bacterium]|nr:1-acyl-sn-glycerol-3-phosphate acyltransferase [Acidimicrobiales bacterium]